MKPYFKSDGIAVYHSDATSMTLPPYDLLVTSPPYNLNIAYAGGHNDQMPYADYLEFSARWLSHARSAALPDARLCMNIPLDTSYEGLRPVYADVLTVAQRVGWRYKTTIIWQENNISRRTAWGSWRSASAPHVIAPVEMIAVLYAENWKREPLPHRTAQSDIAKDEFIAWTNGAWVFNGETSRSINHPVPFPIELPRRLIKLFSYVGDVVLDPFMGSGTTLLAARECRRLAIGIDISEDYCAEAVRRLQFGYTQRLL